MEREFWEKNVLGGKAPVPDGSEATTSYINAKYAKSNGQVVELPESALEIVQRYEDISEQMRSVKERKDALANQLKDYLGENEAGTVCGRKVTWKLISKTSFDSKKLKAEDRAVYERYLTESSYRRLTVA